MYEKSKNKEDNAIYEPCAINQRLWPATAGGGTNEVFELVLPKNRLEN